MNHRHLLPNEIDLLVDGDAGFGVAPLRAHLAECDDCRGRYDELRLVSEALEAVPHFTPRIRFSDDVMAKVQVIEPWHVALAESARRLIPASKPMRVLAGVGASVAGAAISGGALWLAFRADLAGWMFGLVVDRSRQSIVAGAGEIAGNALGSDATSVLASGGPFGIAVTTGVLVLVALGATLGFRRLAATARAHRS
jgi:hypothetical protein